MNKFMKFLSIKDLREKVLFTLFIIFLFRIGTFVPTPGVRINAIKDLLTNNSFLSMYDLVSGGGMSSFAILGLGIGPYITASIILQLLSVGFENLKDLYESGEVGRKKQKLHTKLLGVVLAAFQSSAISLGFMFSQSNFLASDNPWFILVPISGLTLGAFVVMWFADLIDKKGIGNGVSMLIFISILSRLPKTFIDMTKMAKNDNKNLMIVIGLGVGTLLLLILTIYVQECVRKIPIQYAKKVSGSRLPSSNSSHLPLKLNQGGVMPVIFASTIISLPQMIPMVNMEWINPATAEGLVVYITLESLLIFAFTYFTLLTMFNIDEIAENLRKQGGFVPGIRPGESTVEYLSKITYKLNFIGSLFLILVSILPVIVGFFMKIPMLFGGTSLLIAVSVALDTVRRIKSEVTLKTHKGFLG